LSNTLSKSNLWIDGYLVSTMWT